MIYKLYHNFINYITSAMSQGNINVTANHLYEEAFNIKYKWEKFLPKEVFKYHDLIAKECNAPVDLQMGTILPFVASCIGPKTKGVFLTQPSCLNLLWIVVGDQVQATAKATNIL